MAGFANFATGLLDGIRAGSSMARDAQTTQALALRNAQMQRDYQEQRELKDGRKAAITEAIAAGTTPAQAREEGPIPEKRAPIWHSLDSAAQKRLQAGDLDGYEAMTQKSIALKTMHFGTKLNRAALTGDPGQIASVMNEMSPDYRFDARLDEKTGAVVGTVHGPEGRTIPLSFKSVPEMVQMTRAFATQGNVAATFQEQAKLNAELALKGAQTKNYEAQTTQHQAQTGLIQANTTTENETRPQKTEEHQARIGLLGAQTAHQLASASREAQGKQTAIEQTVNGLVRLGVDRETALAHAMGKGDRAKAREQLITEVATKLAAATPGTGQEPITPEEAMRRAVQIVDSAAMHGGTAKVGSGPGMRIPGGSPGSASGRGMGGKAKLPALDAAESRRAAEIKAAVRAGSMSREDALSELKALGFQ